MIDDAARPMLYLGGGVVHSGASALALALADKAALPTVMSLMALGARHLLGHSGELPDLIARAAGEGAGV